MESTTLPGRFEQVAKGDALEDGTPFFYVVELEGETRWLSQLTPDGRISRLLEVGQRPIVQLRVLPHRDFGRPDLRVLLDDQGTLTSYDSTAGSGSVQSRDVIGVWVRRLYRSDGTLAEICDPEQLDRCHVRGVVTLRPRSLIYAADLLRASEDLVFASAESADLEEYFVFWATERERRLRALVDGTEVVLPAAAEALREHAFETVNQQLNLLVDNTCTVYDVTTGRVERLANGDTEHCQLGNGLIASPDGCIIWGGVDLDFETKWWGIVCGLESGMDQAAANGGYAAVLRGETLSMVRSNLFDDIPPYTARP